MCRKRTEQPSSIRSPNENSTRRRRLFLTPGSNNRDKDKSVRTELD